MKKRTLLFLASIVFVLSFVTFGTSYAESKVYRWKFPVFWDKGSYYWEINGPEFAELVKEMSNGQLILTPFGPGEIVSALDQADALSRGTFEIRLLTQICA